MFAHACRLGAEGIVSKRLGSLCRSGPCQSWVKIKNPAAVAVNANGARIGTANNRGAGEVANELKNVQRKFADLIRSELRKFPDARQKLEAPTERGVYVIYGPRGEALHVGGTPRAKNGIRQRLTDHLHARSSFTEKSKYLRNKVKRGTQQGRSDWVRSNCSYRCLPIEDDRMRALLECYTIGQLCPDHIGIHRTEA